MLGILLNSAAFALYVAPAFKAPKSDKDIAAALQVICHKVEHNAGGESLPDPDGSGPSLPSPCDEPNDCWLCVGKHALKTVLLPQAPSLKREVARRTFSAATLPSVPPDQGHILPQARAPPSIPA
jgi:hypothetical protein